MNQEHILNKLDRLSNLFADYVIEPNTFTLYPEKKTETEELMIQITDFLVENPGKLFFHEDSESLKRYETVVDLLWNTFDSDEIFDKLHDSGYSGLLSDMMLSYSRRVKMLKPTFISVKPDSTEFSMYFEEAMKAWLYGVPNAALFICFTVVEDVLKDRLRQINVDYVYELKDSYNPKGVWRVSFDRIIMAAKNEGLINYQEKNILFDIKKKRNNSIHDLAPVSDEEVYDAIMQTKKIVEKLLQ